MLDEVEKAHPDVLEIFYQVFDKGMMEDGEGREIDFKNTIILLTTNACTDQLMKLAPIRKPCPQRKDRQSNKAGIEQDVQARIPGRMVVIPYYPIRDET